MEFLSRESWGSDRNSLFVISLLTQESPLYLGLKSDFGLHFLDLTNNLQFGRTVMQFLIAQTQKRRPGPHNS